MLAREGGSLKVTVHQLPSTSASPLMSLAAARPVPLSEQQCNVYFTRQASCNCNMLIPCSLFESEVGPTDMMVVALMHLSQPRTVTDGSARVMATGII